MHLVGYFYEKFALYLLYSSGTDPTSLFLPSSSALNL